MTFFFSKKSIIKNYTFATPCIINIERRGIYKRNAFSNYQWDATTLTLLNIRYSIQQIVKILHSISFVMYAYTLFIRLCVLIK